MGDAPPAACSHAFSVSAPHGPYFTRDIMDDADPGGCSSAAGDVFPAPSLIMGDADPGGCSSAAGDSGRASGAAAAALFVIDCKMQQPDAGISHC